MTKGFAKTIGPMTLVISALLVCAVPLSARAATLTVTMQRATPNGSGEVLGRIDITDSADGAVFTPDLHGLPPGPHGFHLHENGNCDPTLLNGVRIPAGAAGGHWDPNGTGKHAGPMGDGHMGDLPVLQVANDGTATARVTAPHIKSVSLLRGHSLVIHAGGDNYSDEPVPMGGGGLRLACGVIAGNAQ